MYFQQLHGVDSKLETTPVLPKVSHDHVRKVKRSLVGEDEIATHHGFEALAEGAGTMNLTSLDPPETEESSTSKDDEGFGGGPEASGVGLFDEEDMALMLQTLMDHNATDEDKERRLFGGALGFETIALESGYDSNLCLDVQGACYREGQKILMYQCNGGGNQRWNVWRGKIYMYRVWSPNCNPVEDVFLLHPSFEWCVTFDNYEARLYQCRDERDSIQRFDWDGQGGYISLMDDPSDVLDHEFNKGEAVFHSRHDGSNQDWYLSYW